MTKSEADVLNWAAQLQGFELQASALRPLIQKAARAAASGDIEEWHRQCRTVLSHEDEAFAATALRFLLSYWTGTKTLDDNRRNRSCVAEAENWLTTLPPGPRNVMAAREVLRWAFRSSETDVPGNALALLQNSATGAAEEAARQIILGAHNIGPSARDWMLPLLTGPDREALILRTARQYVPGLKRDWGLQYGGQYGTHGDAILWAADLSDPAVRDPLVYGLYRQWQEYAQDQRLKEDDAAQWAARTALQPEVKAVIERAQSDFTPDSKPGRP